MSEPVALLRCNVFWGDASSEEWGAYENGTSRLGCPVELVSCVNGYTFCVS